MAKTKDLKLVGFQIGRETFAVPIELVHEIVRVPAITSIPEAAACVEGVMNLRGRIIPMIDLRKRFGETAIPYSKNTRVLVAEVEGRLVGLLVDAASEVLRLTPAQIEAPPDVFQQGDIAYITGLGKLDSRLIILVDLAQVLRRGELKRISEPVGAN